jgi:hypothetical protein
VNPDDAEIEAFHRAARKRKAWIFGIAAIVSILAGAGALVVAFSVDVDGGRFEVRAFAASVALIVAGVGMGYNAYRIGTGQIADVDS